MPSHTSHIRYGWKNGASRTMASGWKNGLVEGWKNFASGWKHGVASGWKNTVATDLKQEPIRA